MGRPPPGPLPPTPEPQKLTAAGARPDQVAKLTIYVAGYTSEYLPVIEQARVELFGHHKPADTLIGVARLARPEFLIEVDAIAVK